MRFERKFYGVKTSEIPDATDYEVNDVVDQLNDMFGKSSADWFEEEARFELGELTILVFKLTWYEDDPNKKPAGEFKPFFDGGIINPTELNADHFAIQDNPPLRGDSKKFNPSDYDDSWW